MNPPPMRPMPRVFLAMRSLLVHVSASGLAPARDGRLLPEQGEKETAQRRVRTIGTRKYPPSPFAAPPAASAFVVNRFWIQPQKRLPRKLPEPQDDDRDQALGRGPDVPGGDHVDIDVGDREEEDVAEAVEGERGDDQPGRPADDENDVADAARPGCRGSCVFLMPYFRQGPGRRKAMTKISAIWAMVMTAGDGLLADADRGRRQEGRGQDVIEPELGGDDETR